MSGTSSSRADRRPARVELYRLLADSARLKILALCAEEELSVGELSSLLKDSQPQISRKAARLRLAGLLASRRDGTRTWLKAKRANGKSDPVVSDALEEGHRLCLKDGSLARVPAIVSAREESGQVFFEEIQANAGALTSDAVSPTVMAHLSALGPLLPGHSLAVDVGTGEGLLLDALAPLYARVIAVDRSPAQLARCASRVAERGLSNVSLFPGSYDDVALMERVEKAGGADLVFASRTLHHASRPSLAIASFARLLRKGGHLVVLDYRPHDDEPMREDQGDVWSGFAPEQLRLWMTEAGLEVAGEVSIPPAFHPQGPDARLDWHAVLGRKPAVFSHPNQE